MARARKRRRADEVSYEDLAHFLRVTGMAQAALAAAVGTTQATIYRVVTGERMPRPALAERLASYCHIPLDSFTRVYLARRRKSQVTAAR